MPVLPTPLSADEALRSAKIRLEQARYFLDEARRRLGLIEANGKEAQNRFESLRLQVAAHIVAMQTAKLTASASSEGALLTAMNLYGRRPACWGALC